MQLKPPRMLRWLGVIRRDARGLAVVEFALGTPLVLTVSLYGLELANLALSHLRVSQIALTLADNVSRVGVNGLSTQQLREVDVNDVFQAARVQGAGLQISTNGRMTLSSLEEKSGSQVIHWQRCLGLKTGVKYDSSYGITATNNQSTGATYDPTAGVNTATGGADNSASHPGSTTPGGMGEPGAKVTAPAASGVIFVEVNYDYQPIVSTKWLPGGSARLHYVASFIVRDRRDFSQIFNPGTGATRLTCNLHTV